MYTADVTGAQILLTYSDIFKEDKPDLIESIKNLNMHKAISIICELFRVRDILWKAALKKQVVQ